MSKAATAVKAKPQRRAGKAAASALAEVTPELRARVAERVLRSRIRLALSQPFLATALMRLPVREVAQSSWCATAATDGYHLFYNPAWVAGLADAELRGVLAHEVLHVLFAHGQRRGGRSAQRWNVACDYAINLLLVEQGFRLPEGGLIAKRWQGMTAEEVYEHLAADVALWAAATGRSADDRDQPEEAQSGALPGIGPDLLDPDDPRVRPLRAPDAPDAGQLEELRRELRDNALAQLQGDAAGAFRRECEADDERRIDWRTLLRSWLHERIKGDWQSYPFSKRHLHRGLFMPSPGLAVPGHVVFAIDTSASMQDETLAQLTGELRAFRETFPCRLTVLQADARVQSIHTFEAMDGTEIPQRLPLAGGGGTDFRPVFDWVSTHTEGAIVLYATDGMGRYPDRAPHTPVIWLLTPPHVRKQEVPFGVVVGLTKTHRKLCWGSQRICNALP
jgi:predicted metal-dependent peptidase